MYNRNYAPAAPPPHASWDSKAFLKKYTALKNEMNHGDNLYQKVKDMRVEEFQNTIQLATAGKYVTEDGVEVIMPSDSESLRNSVFYLMAEPVEMSFVAVAGISHPELRDDTHIAKLFHEVLEEQEFKNKYRLLCFAILEDHNAHKRHNPEGNFMPFKKEFGR